MNDLFADLPTPPPRHAPGDAAMVIAGDLPPPAQRSSPTSVAAGRKKQSTASIDRERIYDFIAKRGEYGATRDEIEVELGIAMQSVTPRVWELTGKARGFAVRIVANGKKRLTARNCMAEVLVVKG